jgi:hypothetical protein
MKWAKEEFLFEKEISDSIQFFFKNFSLDFYFLFSDLWSLRWLDLRYLPISWAAAAHFTG